MSDRLIEERELSIEDYLSEFDPESADYPLLRQRSEKLARITVKKMADGSGRTFEDTTFTEKNGVHYTIRAYLD